MPEKNSSDSPSRIERGNYLAEVLQGSSTEPFWYYVIHRKGSNEIIDLMKFDSRDHAMEAARLVLDRINEAVATARS